MAQPRGLSVAIFLSKKVGFIFCIYKKYRFLCPWSKKVSIGHFCPIFCPIFVCTKNQNYYQYLRSSKIFLRINSDIGIFSRYLIRFIWFISASVNLILITLSLFFRFWSTSSLFLHYLPPRNAFSLNFFLFLSAFWIAKSIFEVDFR